MCLRGTSHYVLERDVARVWPLALVYSCFCALISLFAGCVLTIMQWLAESSKGVVHGIVCDVVPRGSHGIVCDVVPRGSSKLIEMTMDTKQWI